METVSYSELKRWRSCRQAHHYGYIQRIEPKRKPKAVEMGFVIHDLLETHAVGQDWREAWREFRDEFQGMFLEEQEYYGKDTPDQVKRILEGYFRHWEDDPLEYHMVEEKIGPIPLTPWTALKGVPDGIVEDGSGRLWLLERKTTSRVPAQPRLWEFQTILYVWALRQLGHEVDGILWDFIRRKAPKVPRVLKSGELTRRKNLDSDVYTYRSKLEEEGLDPAEYQETLERLEGRGHKFFNRIYIPVQERMMEPVIRDARRTSLEIVMLGDMEPQRNLANFHCKGCFYNDLCYAELRGLDTEYMIEANYQPKGGRGDGEEESEEEEQ